MRIKNLVAVALSTAIFVSCADTSHLDKEIEDLKNAVAELQQQCRTINSSLETLDVALAALKNRDYVTSVQVIKGSDGKVTGYTMTFVNLPTITIWLPEEGQGTDPADLPVISVKMGQDGVYYWTCDGEYITDENGNMIPAGTEGQTPKLKVEDGKWYECEDKYFNPYARLVNIEYVYKFEQFKYSACELYKGEDVIKYLRML